MANQLANQQTIDLTSQLNTNRNKNDILPFSGFNKRQNPYLNGTLKTFFENKNKTADAVDVNGNLYTWDENGDFKKNGELISTVAPWEVKKTEYDTYRGTSSIPRFYIKENVFAFCYESSGYAYFYIENNGNTKRIAEVSLSSLDKFDKKFDFYIDDTNTYGIFTFVTASFDSSLKANALIFKLSDVDNNTIPYITFANVAQGTNETPYKISDSSEWNAYCLVDKYDSTYDVFYLCMSPGKYTSGLFNTSTDKLSLAVVNKNSFEVVYNPYISYSGYHALWTTGENNILLAKISKSDTALNISYKGKLTLSRSSSNVWSYTTTIYTSNSDIGKYISVQIYSSYSETITSYSTPRCVANRFFQYISVPFSYKEGSFKSVVTISSMDDCAYIGGSVSDVNGTIALNCRAPLFQKNESINLCFNNNSISGLSLSQTSSRMGVIVEPWLSIDSSIVSPYVIVPAVESGTSRTDIDNVSVVYSTGEKTIIATITKGNKKLQLLGNRYILFSTINTYNLYDTILDKWYNFGSDWNNRVFVYNGVKENPVFITADKNRSCSIGEIASGRVDYINLSNPVPTAIFNPSLCSVPYFKYNSDPKLPLENYVYPQYSSFTDIDIYLSDTAANPQYLISYGSSSFKKNTKLSGTSYPAATDNNISLNPDITASFSTSDFGYSFVKEGEKHYILRNNNNALIFAYAYGTGMDNIENLFCIQGQLFCIRNSIISSAIISDNVLSNVNAIISNANLKYLGCTSSTAYFWGEKDKYIYIFTGDRKLSKAYEFSEVTEIRDSVYSIDTDSFYIVTDNGLYVTLNESYIYTIPGNYKAIQILKKGIALQSKENESKWDFYSYYNEEGEIKPVIIETAYYGAMDNKLSVIDTWYIRLYSEEAKAGDITCSLVTITDTATETAEQTFHITKEQWNPLSKTVLIRYQPKYQRSIGTSLKVVSDFDIQDLQCSYSTDTAVQVSKVVTTKLTGGKI